MSDECDTDRDDSGTLKRLCQSVISTGQWHSPSECADKCAIYHISNNFRCFSKQSNIGNIMPIMCSGDFPMLRCSFKGFKKFVWQKRERSQSQESTVKMIEISFCLCVMAKETEFQCHPMGIFPP
jgi:hypothetical protein